MPEYGCLLSCTRKKIRKSASRREVRRVAGPSSGSSWQLYVTAIYLYMLGTTTTLSMLFQVLELWSLVRILLDFKLGLAVTEININFQINIKKV